MVVLSRVSVVVVFRVVNQIARPAITSTAMTAIRAMLGPLLPLSSAISSPFVSPTMLALQLPLFRLWQEWCQ
jgi:hypothetical protein